MKFNKRLIARMIVPYGLFLVAFAVFEGFFTVFASCDCFFNFRDIIFVCLVLVYASMMFYVESKMRKQGKEYTIFYTGIAIVSFLATYYLIMNIGEYLY